MRRAASALARIPNRLAAMLAAGGALVLAAAPPAGADPGWTRSPASGVAGGTVQVASSSTTLCRWPAVGSETPAAVPVVHDGTRVELRLSRAGIDAPLGGVAVTAGGAWAGSVTVPGTDVAPPGDYDIVATCIVDDADRTRSFDFERLDFVVVEAPPPTTVTSVTTAPPKVEIGEPLTVTRTEVEGVQIDRGTSTATDATSAPRTLPDTGGGTLAVAVAGVAALALGGVAIRLGARRGSAGSDAPTFG